VLDRVLGYAKVGALVSVTFLCVALGISLLSVRADIALMRADLHGATQQLTTTMTQLTTTVKQVGDELTTDANRLTTRADRLMISAGATTREAHLVAQYQRQFWEKQTPEMVQRASLLLDNANQLLQSSNTAVVGLTAAGTQLKGNLEQMTGAFTETAAEGTKAFRNLNTLGEDPDLKAIKENLARLSGGTAKMSEDAAVKFHRYVYPTENLTGLGKVWFYIKGGLGFLKDAFMAWYMWP